MKNSIKKRRGGFRFYAAQAAHASPPRSRKRRQSRSRSRTRNSTRRMSH